MNQQTSPLQLKDSIQENHRLSVDSTVSKNLHGNNLIQYTETYFDHNKTNIEESKHDNYEDKINNIKQNKQLLSSTKKQKRFMIFRYIQSIIDKIKQLQLTKHHIIMIILNILMFITLLLVYEFSRRYSMNKSIDVEEVLVMKRGKPYGGPGGEDLWDDAEIASLTFDDTITHVIASQSVDLSGEPLLLSLTFSYSNNRIGKEYGGIGRRGQWEDLNALELSPGEHIDRITIYEGYRNITNHWRNDKLTYIIVGIYFETDRDQQILYGSTNGIEKKESPSNYFLAYVQGKAGGHIDSLRFTWYRYCLKNSTIIEENHL